MGDWVYTDRRLESRMETPAQILSCPNCASTQTECHPKGRLAPFFVRRVFGVEPPRLSVMVPSRLGQVIPRLIARIRWLDRPRPLACPILICSDCEFVCPAIPLSDDQLLNLYRDYRSKTYNDERSLLEPGYAVIADRVGRDPAEVRRRNAHAADFLNGVDGLDQISTVLDFGGADGRFIPQLLRNANCLVYDPSSVPPHDPAIQNVTTEADLRTYDYVQACHILEHVSQPRKFLVHVMRYLRASGLLYLEVPQDKTSIEIAALHQNNNTQFFHIHEHINLYTKRSLRALVESVGLHLMKIESAVVDLGWCRTAIVSAVAKRQLATACAPADGPSG